MSRKVLTELEEHSAQQEAVERARERARAASHRVGARLVGGGRDQSAVDELAVLPPPRALAAATRRLHARPVRIRRRRQRSAPRGRREFVEVERRLRLRQIDARRAADERERAAERAHRRAPTATRTVYSTLIRDAATATST
jgi:hypothetical protein